MHDGLEGHNAPIDAPIVRWLLIIAGLTSVSVGLIGIVVPLLPTTVFLIIGAAWFARSSVRLHSWLLGHRWFGPYIRHYQEHRAITRRGKILAIVTLWLAIGSSIIIVSDKPWLQLLLVLIAAGVTTYLLRLKTMTPEMLGCASVVSAE